MPKLVLQFEGRVLKECALAGTVTIGRLPDNTVVIDNPAVSARHARVVHDGDTLVVEDLESRNGTFVNRQRVTRHVLQNGDIVQVGKHALVYERVPGDEARPVEALTPEPIMPDLGGTMLLDTEKHRKLVADMEARLRAQKAQAAAQAIPAGVLRVLRGRADQTEYALDGHEAIIGRSETALVRLRGWFKPKMALAIARMGESYVATLLGGTTLVNGQRLTGRRGLENGDLLQVGGLTLEFRLKGQS
jgi:pSer/pThr/pTyr-binding forkhead associated (FHA) protein